MTETLHLLGLGSLKVVVLLAAATALTQVLDRRPARIRAVVWATALAGALLMPLAAPFVPQLELPLPEVFGSTMNQASDKASTFDRYNGYPATDSSSVTRTAGLRSITGARSSDGAFTWATAALMVWIIPTAALLFHLVIGFLRVRRTVKAAVPLASRKWAALHDLAIRQVGFKRTVRLLISTDIEIPATVGVFRPVVLIPSHGEDWHEDRQMAVLLHELVHVRRLDWAVRMLARVAKAVYWFIPLTWWAVRRLDLEQELACDEEVVALGTPPADYADHLLGIARAAVLNPARAIPGMAMARTPDLEKRIMTLLNNTSHRRVGIAVLIPAVTLVAAMVSALAAVSPSATEVRNSSPSENRVTSNSEIAGILAEMDAVEEELESHLVGVEAHAAEIERQFDAIDIEPIEIDEEALAKIEEAMKPHLERIEEIEIDMAPLEAEMEKIEATLEGLELHIEDGTLEEVERQIDQQVRESLKQIELAHEAMEPHLKQLELVHVEMEEFYKQMETIHQEMEPHHQAMEEMHRELEPLHEEMELIHEQMEPLHQKMEEISGRLENAVADEVAAVLRSKLAPVTGSNAPFWEAAKRIVDGGRIHVQDDTMEVQSPFGDTQEVLQDLFAGQRVGTEEAFNSAVNAAASDLENLQILLK